MTIFEDALSRELEGPIASYIVLASYFDQDGQIMLYLNTPEDQPIHITSGLIEFAKVYVTKKFINDLNMD